jgi:hypothetical protein
MCEFFSFVTEPELHGGKRYYFNWHYRKAHLQEENDSHSLICKHYKLDEDKCNKYEFNPLRKIFKTDDLHSQVNDVAQAEEWVRQLDFKKVCEPLVIKNIVNPFALPEVTEITPEMIELLKQWNSVRDSVWASVRDSVRASVWTSVRDSVWASVRDSVWASVRDSVRASVWTSVRDSVGASVGDSVGASVGASVWDSVWAYISSFFAIEYKHDYSSCVKLWEMGLVPSYDGTAWRLHTGKNAKVVYEMMK